VTIADTSCLILLDKIGRIDLLESVFGKITVTRRVAYEFQKQLPESFEITNPQDDNYQKLLMSFLDSGEASVIALAVEQKDCLLIIDESRGRREVKSLGLKFTGTLGVLLIAKEKGIIKSVTELIDEIGRTNFRISEALLTEVKHKAGE